MPKLVFTSAPLTGKTYDLLLEKTTVGRADQNALVIHDPSLSAAHCEILLHGPEIIVRDLDSRNGTFINDSRLQNTQAQLKHGQRVRFGAIEARLELDGEPDDSTTASDITAVYAHGRAVRDQRREEKDPKPKPPEHQHLGSDAAPATDEQTLVVRQPAVTPAPKPATAAPASASPKKSAAWIWLLVALVLVAMVIAWKVLGGK